MGVQNLGYRVDFESAIIPVDLSTAGNVGAYVSVVDCDELGLLIYKAAGGATDIPLTIEQATAQAGTGNKNLVAVSEYYTKQATLLTSTPVWTEVEIVKTATPTITGSGSKQAIIYVPIRITEVDVANGFKYVRATIGQLTGATLGAMLYVRGGLSVERDPPRMVNANV